MNRLWVRLSLAFSAVTLVSTLIIVTAGTLTLRSEGIRGVLIEQFQSPGGLIDQLSSYYRQHDGWTHIADFWIDQNRIVSVPPGDMTVILSIADETGQIIFGTNLPKFASKQTAVAELPINVDGFLRGYLVISQVEMSPPRDGGLFFVPRITGALLTFGVITALVGIAFGALMSRSLTAPLSRLAEAAHTIGTRKQFKRVSEEGTAEVRELARAFNEMSGALEQAETLRRNMVADVAHELRTPLSVLQGNLSAIVEGVYPLSKDEISALYAQTRVLSRLVNDLHELSQAEAAKLPLNLQPTNIGNLVESQVITFGTLAEGEGVTLSSDIQPNLPDLSVDPVRLAQVLSNLISNALVHTPAGGTITVNARQDDDQIVMAVQDSGQGIAREHLPYIFERFYRTDSSRSRQTGGAGLGLAIARALIEAHGGYMTAESDGIPGKGSLFSIHLPLQLPNGS